MAPQRRTVAGSSVRDLINFAAKGLRKTQPTRLRSVVRSYGPRAAPLAATGSSSGGGGGSGDGSRGGSSGSHTTANAAEQGRVASLLIAGEAGTGRTAFTAALAASLGVSHVSYFSSDELRDQQRQPLSIGALAAA